MSSVQPDYQDDSKNIVSLTGDQLAVSPGPVSPGITLPDQFEEVRTGKPGPTDTNSGPGTMNENFADGNISVDHQTGKEQYIQDAFENAFIGIVIVDFQGIVIHSNHAFSDITGYSEEELRGRKYLSIIHPEDVKAQEEVWHNLMSNVTSYVTTESRYQSKLAQTVWVRNSFSVMKTQDILSANIMIISINIEQEKSAEQKAAEVTRRFRFLADSMPEQIWTADAEGNLNYFSHAFCDYSGITVDEIPNCTWTNIVYEEDIENTCNLWKQSIETGEEFLIEHRLKRKDGNFKWQLSRAIAHRDIQGKITLWVGATSNIHRQKTVEEELERQVLERTRDLQQANFNLEHSNYDLEQFAYIATHDLQEPLRKIRTYSSLMNKRFTAQLPEEARDYMVKIENASERMAILIDDLLNYSLLLRPQEAFEISDINLIMNQVLKDVDSLIKEKNAVIYRVNLPQLRVIPMQIYQLFYNLLTNALKFASEERAPVIEITTRTVTEAEALELHLDIDLSYIEIAFKDNGIGFSQQYAEKIFSIFQRLNNRTKYPGTGIGLALCRKIMLFHHGLIYTLAKENEGATFFVLLSL